MTTRVLCVASRLLGNRTFAEALVGILAAVPSTTLTCRFLDADDYAAYTPAWVYRWSDPLAVHQVAQAKWADLNARDFDVLVISAWDLLPSLAAAAEAVPTILALDTTPAAAARVKLGQPGWRGAPVSVQASKIIQGTRFKRAIRHVRWFLPMSEWCADSLKNDYGVPSDRVIVTGTPIDTCFWSPAPRRAAQASRLLFVGNDLIRKGLPFLLSLFQGRALANEVTLDVVSNDPRLKSFSNHPQIRTFSGVDQIRLRDLYRQSDVLILPTTLDYSPNVIVEAASCGVPAIATDVGAISELIADRASGRVVRKAASATEWAAVIADTLSDPESFQNMRAYARKQCLQRHGRSRLATIMTRLLTAIESDHPIRSD